MECVFCEVPVKVSLEVETETRVDKDGYPDYMGEKILSVNGIEAWCDCGATYELSGTEPSLPAEKEEEDITMAVNSASISVRNGDYLVAIGEGKGLDVYTGTEHSWNLIYNHYPSTPSWEIAKTILYKIEAGEDVSDVVKEVLTSAEERAEEAE